MTADIAGLYAAIIAFLVVLAIVWILLPFAVFGVKPKLDAIAAELRKTNALLTQLNARSAAGTPGATAPQPPATGTGPSGEKLIA